MHTCLAFLDADIQVLGWDEDAYDDYSWRIWKEFEFVGRKTYCQKRIPVLEKFLEKERLFETVYFEAFEEQARKNLKREIESLKKEV